MRSPRRRTSPLPLMSDLAKTLSSTVGEVLRGKDEAIELAIITLFAGGHLLIEDFPGVGKTLLARSLARALDLPFQRIQCTADLLPADIVGGQIYNPRDGELTFRPGPVFTSVLLADELNRTPPRTQSALLECMAERSITVHRETRQLPDPFFVIATQNPTTSTGTYPLPENQLDRFLLRIRIGYPAPEHEAAVVAQEDGHKLANEVSAIASHAELLEARAQVDDVRCDQELAAHIVELANRTRNTGNALLGVSTRGAQALHRACRSRACVQGRDYVVPDDIRVLLTPAWGHRMHVRGDADGEALLHEILATTALPD